MTSWSGVVRSHSEVILGSVWGQSTLPAKSRCRRGVAFGEVLLAVLIHVSNGYETDYVTTAPAVLTHVSNGYETDDVTTAPYLRFSVLGITLTIWSCSLASDTTKTLHTPNH